MKNSKALRDAYKKGVILTVENIEKILTERKKDASKVKYISIDNETYNLYFSENSSPEFIQDTIKAALKLYKDV